MTYGGKQIVVHKALVTMMQNLSNFAKPSVHSVDGRLYHFLRRSFYRPYMCVDCYTKIHNCVICAMNCVNLRLHNKLMKIIPALAPRELAAINLPGAFVTTSRNNKHLYAMSNRFSRLVRTVPLQAVKAKCVVRAFLSIGSRPMAHYACSCPIMASNSCHNFLITSVSSWWSRWCSRTNRRPMAKLSDTIALLSPCSTKLLNSAPKLWDLYTAILTFGKSTQIHRITIAKGIHYIAWPWE